MDSDNLDSFIKKKCYRDCRIISNTKIKEEESDMLFELIGKDLYQELEKIANEVHNNK